MSLGPICQRKIDIFMLCILMNNFYLIWSYHVVKYSLNPFPAKGFLPLMQIPSQFHHGLKHLGQVMLIKHSGTSITASILSYQINVSFNLSRVWIESKACKFVWQLCVNLLPRWDSNGVWSLKLHFQRNVYHMRLHMRKDIHIQH